MIQQTDFNPIDTCDSDPRVKKREIKKFFKIYKETQNVKVREKLVFLHMNLVRYLASRFLNKGESYDDLVQVGSLGLIKAIDRYNPARGVEFTTYAIPTILGEIKRYFRDKGWAIKVPRRLQELSRDIKKAKEKLLSKLKRSPTTAEIACFTDLSEDQIMEAQESSNMYNLISLNNETEFLDRKSSIQLLDCLGRNDIEIENIENQVLLKKAMAKLTEKERKILHLRFFENMPQTTISQTLSVSQMHISRMLQRILGKLKKYIIN